MNYAPYFNVQFVDVDGPLVAGKLYSYISGTTTPQTTYDNDNAPNTNPIILDALGRCELKLDPTLSYTFLLKRADDSEVKTWDATAASPLGGNAVTSVNTQTGAVVLTADDIAYATGSAATWFSGTDVTAALDSIIDHVDSGGSVTAANVSIADAGNYYAGVNVESALQYLGAALAFVGTGSGLPSQTGNSGKFLTTDGSAASWANMALATFTATITGGDIVASVASGDAAYGSRTVAVTGGTTPYTYQWLVTYETPMLSSTYVHVDGSSRAATVAIRGGNAGDTNIASITCLVTDATGRVTTASFLVTATHAA